MNYFKTTIKEYLDKRAKSDALFAKSYAKESKTLDSCCNYIVGEVKKSGRCGFDDSEIFNMAIHYYDEDNIKDIDPISCKVVVNKSISKLNNESKPKQSKTKKIEAFEKRQLSLF